MAGVGDLLALFRCISCRYCFGTDATKPDMLGAPGRVFTTQEVGSAANPTSPNHQRLLMQTTFSASTAAPSVAVKAFAAHQAVPIWKLSKVARHQAEILSTR